MAARERAQGPERPCPNLWSLTTEETDNARPAPEASPKSGPAPSHRTRPAGPRGARDGASFRAFVDLDWPSRSTFASLTHSTSCGRRPVEKELRQAKDTAIEEMSAEAGMLGAHAVIGVDLDYEHIGGGTKSMLMVTASRTAVNLK